MKISMRVILLISCVTAILVALPLRAEEEHHATELAKKLQNPVSDLISVPFQNNFNFGVGPEDKTQYVLNIQPVLPQRISEQWNWIHRAIIPLIDQPAPVDAFGLGDIQYQGFLSPAKPGKLIWGVGPVLQVPSATDDQLGTEKWSAGAGAVALRMDGPWVYGALVNNIWSLTDDKHGGYYNNGLIQPFVNYNFKGGLYLTSAPILTVDWTADSDNRWTIPIGGGVGKIFHLGKLPVNTQLSAYYNAVTPDDGADWQIRAQVQLMFPK